MAVSFVTGGAGGIGREISRSFARHGYDVGIHYNTGKERAEALAAELRSVFGVKALTFGADFAQPESICKMFGALADGLGAPDVLVNNAGYGLFGAAEELSDEQIDDVIATNLTGSIATVRAALPFMRAQKSGRIVQISSYGGQVAYAGNSLYHATKFGIEGFCESVAQEIAPFGVKVTIVEPGGARTDFRYRSAHVAELMPEYDDNPAHAFLRMLDPQNGLAAGDPVRMASRIIEAVDDTQAPLRIVLGSQALAATLECLEKRVTELKKQTELARSTDF